MANPAPQQATDRRGSISQASESSQTAAEYISSQLQLEADAREVLPYQFDTCTKDLGALRQTLFSCITCNPPPTDPSASHTSAGLCYACSISCHGEHDLVELFTRRNFVCDCGTQRLPSTSTCSLRVNQSGTKGGVHSEQPSAINTYNQNFRNRFCGCNELYNPHEEKGTMFQCLGLGTVEQGGCGEDWWHPECIMGLPRDWHKSNEAAGDDLHGVRTDGQATNMNGSAEPSKTSTGLESIAELPETDVPEPNDTAGTAQTEANVEPPIPKGFPDEDDFDHFVCYKCVEALPWIKRYAGTPGFLPPVRYGANKSDVEACKAGTSEPDTDIQGSSATTPQSLKRKADNDIEDSTEPLLKKAKSEEALPSAQAVESCSHAKLPPASSGKLSLFLREDFRDHLCRCRSCFPQLVAHPQLLEEEVVYEPPVSDSGSEDGGEGSVGSRSLLDKGEAALSNMDRVRAIEGVMAYNKLRDNLKDFLKPFAESGTAVGAEDIKKHFEKLRGDDSAIKQAERETAQRNQDGDHRREQGGY